MLIHALGQARSLPDVLDAHDEYLQFKDAQRSGNADQSAIFPEMQRDSGSMMWNILINACAKCGDLPKAEAAFEQMKAEASSSSLAGSSRPGNITYNTLISMYSKAHRMDDVHRMVVELAEAGVMKAEVTFTTLIGAHSLAGDIEAAQQAFNEMESAGMGGNPLAYVVMMNAAVKHRDQGTFLFFCLSFRLSFRLTMDLMMSLIRYCI
jgi:pentatricopeptide repeat protein